MGELSDSIHRYGPADYFRGSGKWTFVTTYVLLYVVR